MRGSKPWIFRVPIARRAPWHARRERSIERASFVTHRALLKTLGYAVLRVPNGLVLQASELFVQKVLSLVFSLPEA